MLESRRLPSIGLSKVLENIALEECLGSAISQFKDLGNYSGDTRKAPTKGKIVSGK